MCVSIVGVLMLLGIVSVRCERQIEVTRARVVQRVSYCEAVKKVEENGSRLSSIFVPVQRDRVMNELCFSKVVFLAFIATVINCTAEMESESQKIDVVVATAEKYLGI